MPNRFISKAEQKELEKFLSSDHVPESCLNLSGIHGLLTSVLMVEELGKPADWQQAVFDSNSDRQPVWESPQQRYRIIGLFEKMYKSVREEVLSPEFIKPFLYHDNNRNPILIDWCLGFMIGVSLNQELWDENLMTYSNGMKVAYPVIFSCVPDEQIKLLSEEFAEEPIKRRVEFVAESATAMRNFWGLPVEKRLAFMADGEDENPFEDDFDDEGLLDLDDYDDMSDEEVGKLENLLNESMEMSDSENDSDPLTADEYTELMDFLELNCAPPSPFELDMLDGFISSLCLVEHLSGPTNWKKHVFSPDGTAEVTWNSPEQQSRIESILDKWYDALMQQQNSDDFLPYLLQDDDGNPTIFGWCSGFMLGTRFNHKVWNRFVNGKKGAQLITPIVALSLPTEVREKEAPELNDFSSREQFMFVGNAIYGLRMFWQWPESVQNDFLKLKIGLDVKLNENGFEPVPKEATVREIKIQRNDPCPCGSGKKYKNCCMKN